MKSINLKLLPDGGLKIKKAILTEENRLKESKMQLNNVLRKLKKFSGNNSLLLIYIPIK